MKNLTELRSMTKYLQERIDEMDISDVQKLVCRRAIWYTVIKNYALRTADKRARDAYGITYSRIPTKKYILDVFNKHLGVDYFVRKEKIREVKFFEKIGRQ